MGKCLLCGKKISSDKSVFGLNCLKKVCTAMGITDIKNLNGEKILNKKIQKNCGKEGLSKEQEILLTNRYLTFQLLNEVKLDEYDKYRKLVQKDIEIINKNVDAKDLKSIKKITLKQANEINKKYKKNKGVLKKIIDGDYDSLQNISFNTIRFAFNMYYLNKPYLSDLNQKLQYGILKFGVSILKSANYNFSAECLDHSLEKNAKDMTFTDEKIIEKIKNDKNFEQKINEIVNKYRNKSTFITNNDEKELVSFKNGDLFYSLHNATIIVSGKKQKYFWNLDIEISDVYDFTDFKELKEYINNKFPQNVIGASANNFAMISVSSKVVQEYKITIKFQMKKIILPEGKKQVILI